MTVPSLHFRRFLDPIERSSEVLFGLIMVLVYTGSISVAERGEQDVNSVLIGAIGCNLAWAVIDAAMYLMDIFAGRARGLVTLRAIRRTSDHEAAHRLIADAIPPGLSNMLGVTELEALRRRLTAAAEPDTGFRYDDYMAAAGVFLLVFLSTFPVVVPFVLMRDASTALRVSQVIGMAMLYVAGWSLGRHAGRPAWRTGLGMVVVGAVFSALTYALGG